MKNGVSKASFHPFRQMDHKGSSCFGGPLLYAYAGLSVKKLDELAFSIISLTENLWVYILKVV